MPGMVDVLIPIEADAAAELSDDRKRAAVGRIVSRLLRPQPGSAPNRLIETMERMAADAAARGLTPELLESELAAHKAGRTR